MLQAALLVLLGCLIGGGLVTLGGWGMKKILEPSVVTTEDLEELDNAVQDSIDRLFAQLDEKLGLTDDAEDDGYGL